MRRIVLLSLSILALTATVAQADTCPPGFVGPAGNTPCTPCPIGSFNAVPGSEACEDCPAGFYQPNEGAIACLPCEAGRYQPNPGAGSCLDCPEGYIAPNVGSAQCIPCQTGFTSNASHTACVEASVSTSSTTWSVLKARYM